MAQKKFYEEIDQAKRVAAEFPPKQFKMLRFLQVDKGVSEKDVILSSVEEKYAKCIEQIAVETGLLKESKISFSRDEFQNDALFNSICLSLNMFGGDGRVESVNQVSLEISKSFVSE